MEVFSVMDALKGALKVGSRLLLRQAEVNGTAEVTIAIAYQRLLDEAADPQAMLNSVQPRQQVGIDSLMERIPCHE
jgi:hypothetical protein